MFAMGLHSQEGTERAAWLVGGSAASALLCYLSSVETTVRPRRARKSSGTVGCACGERNKPKKTGLPTDLAGQAGRPETQGGVAGGRLAVGRTRPPVRGLRLFLVGTSPVGGGPPCFPQCLQSQILASSKKYLQRNAEQCLARHLDAVTQPDRSQR